jgi:hypothetical protein
MESTAALQRTFQDSTNDSTTMESTAGFTKDIFRTPQMTARPWSRLLLALQRTFVCTTMDGSHWYGKTLKSPDKFSKDPKDCTTSFSWQRLTYQAASAGSYDERCGPDNEISVR